MIRRIWDITLTVRDLEYATWFYETVLGLSKKYAYKDYVGFDCGGIELGLKTWGELEPTRAGEPVIIFLVDDVDAAYERLRAQAVFFTQQPTQAKWGARIASFVDPDGNFLQITEVDWQAYHAAGAKG